MRILYNFKGNLGKSEQIVGTSNISEFDRPTILKKMCAKGDLGSEEKCTITKLLGIGQSTLKIEKHLGRDHRNNNIPRLFLSFRWGSLGYINHFYRIDDRDDKLSRSNNGITESGAVQ